jgi:hypothetical protein
MAEAKVHDINLPRDASGNAAQVLEQGTITNGAVGASAAALALPSNAKVVFVTATTDLYFRFATSATTGTTSSNGAFLAAGTGRPYDVGANTHIDHIRDSADGRMTIEALI